MLIHEALACFETQLVADGRSWHTLDQYRRHVRFLASWLESSGQSLILEEIGHVQIAAFFAAPETTTCLDGRKKKSSSLNCVRSSLRSFFGYLHEAGVVNQNPARLLRRAIEEPPLPRSLSKAEEHKLLRALESASSFPETRDAVLIRFLLGSGVRLASALMLKVEDIDFGLGRADVLTKGNRAQTCLLSSSVQRFLESYLGTRKTGYVFCGQLGGKLSTRHIQRRFADLRTSLDMDYRISLHSLRHTFATRLLGKTNDLGLVRIALNHKCLTSTLRYVQRGEERLKDALG